MTIKEYILKKNNKDYVIKTQNTVNATSLNVINNNPNIIVTNNYGTKYNIKDIGVETDTYNISGVSTGDMQSQHITPNLLDGNYLINGFNYQIENTVTSTIYLKIDALDDWSDGVTFTVANGIGSFYTTKTFKVYREAEWYGDGKLEMTIKFRVSALGYPCDIQLSDGFYYIDENGDIKDSLILTTYGYIIFSYDFGTCIMQPDSMYDDNTPYSFYNIDINITPSLPDYVTIEYNKYTPFQSELILEYITQKESTGKVKTYTLRRKTE